jgi:4-amino-4-deoxy-L-arabinose transferase-like glycosyltransferase
VRRVNFATPINSKQAANVSVRNYALLFAACVLFHVAGTWNLPLIDRDEPRFAEASREMIERSDYIVPYFNNHFRFDKPPLTYWAQVASYKVFGQNDFAARFPSAIAAALVALSIFTWGARVGGEKVGWWAAIIFTLSLQTFVHAKAAVADMWLVLFVTLAHWAGYELIGFRKTPTASSDSTIQRLNDLTICRPRHWWWLFYLSLAFGFLAKGPIAWTPLLTVASTIFFARDLQLARRFKFGRGLLLMLSIVALWGIPALIQTHGQFFVVGIGRHVIGRSLATMEGHGANSFGMYLLLLPFYFVTIFLSFFPWSIKLPWLIRKLWGEKETGIIPQERDYNGNKIDNYLIIGIAIIFIIFTLVKTKLPHYTLPAFPLLALLLARHWSNQEAMLSQAPLAAVANRRSLFNSVAIATACSFFVIALVVPPFVARLFPAYQLFQESRDYLRPEMKFGAVDYNEPSLVWYFRSPEGVRGFLTPLNSGRAAEFMAEAGPRFVIVPTSLYTTRFAEHPENWKTFSTRGFNITKGRHVDLTLVLKPE